MELKGKKILFIGDSITEGVGVEEGKKTYWQQLAEATGAECIGYGISGTRIARQQNPVEGAYHDANHFITRLERMEENADAIVVFGGVNDYGHGDAPFGSFDDRSIDTFCGALHCLYSALIEKYPQSRIIIMTPTHWDSEDAGSVRDNGSIREKSLLDYVGAERATAEYYGLPLLDLYKISGIQPKIKAQKDYYMPDGIHPNFNGHKRIFECLLGFLSQL